MTNFVHLHTHSIGSILDGIESIDALLSKAQELGHKHLAITDHHNVFHAITFYKKAQALGINPVLGAELNFVEDAVAAKFSKLRWVSHIVLLAENNIGWQNLIKLISISNNDEYFYYKPRIDFDLLERHSEGLILLTGCIGGIVSQYLFDQYDEYGDLRTPKAIFRAEAVVRRLMNNFDADHLYLEIQDHDTKAEAEVRTQLRKIANKYGLKTVATNNVHYLDTSHATAFGTLKQIEGVMHIKNSFSDISTELYHFADVNEMKQRDFTEAELSESCNIAQRCKVNIDTSVRRLPKYPFLPNGASAEQYLRQRVIQGAKNLNLEKNAQYQARLQKELSDIIEMGFADYFLIVWDVMKWVHEQQILAGPGRGSAGGSLVSYCLGITGIDPIKYGLMWERFLNKGRVGLPDIDTDVPRARRAEVLGYIKSRFGGDYVAQIVTFNKLAARAVLKDVFRVFNLPFDEANKITSLLPIKDENHVPITLESALRMVPELQEYEQQYKGWFTIAKSLEGAYKSLGTHASAVVIADKPFSEGHYPLVRSADNSDRVCAWDMNTVDGLSLLKHDILGLSTLDIIQDTIKLIKKHRGDDINVYDIPLDDKNALTLISEGKTIGIFQLEGQLGKSWSKRIQPNTLEEVANILSIIRPGALESGLAEQYIDVKFSGKKPEYVHPDLGKILDKTYGSLLFQEQVLEICRHFAGLTLEQCDLIRRACGKKKYEEMQAQKGIFVEGCKKNNYSSEVIEALWKLIEIQSGYSFNLSHALGYAIISYWTAYFKANYTIEFICACLRNAKFVQDSSVEISKIITDAKMFDLEIVPPRLDAHNVDFDIISDTQIAFGLSHLKGVGEKAVKSVLSVYNDDFEGFLFGLKTSKVNRSVVEALIKSGALDYFNMPRVRMLAQFRLFDLLTLKEKDAVINSYISGVAHSGDADWIQYVETLSSDDQVEHMKAKGLRPPNINRRKKLREALGSYKGTDPFDGLVQRVAWEEHYLGTALTGNITDMFTSKMKCVDVLDGDPDTKVDIVVQIERAFQHLTKTKQEKMAFLTGRDDTAQLDNLVVFPRIYQNAASILEVGNVVRLKGKISDRGSVIVNNVEYLR